MKSFLLAALLAAGLGCSSSTSTDAGAGASAVRIGNKNTKVFHTTDCRYAKNLTNPINFATRADAVAAGYSADQSGACNP
jgi:hypothetical protein